MAQRNLTKQEQQQLLKQSGLSNLGEAFNIHKNLRQSWVRWLALILACFMMIGNYMSNDFPQYLQNQMGQQIFNCESYSDKNEQCDTYRSYYKWLYSLYSFPNLILPIFGGYMIDRIGVRTGLILFLSFIVIGQLVCALAGILSGGWNDNHKTVFTWLYIGRIVFGLGGENLSVTKSTLISKWFLGKELAFALGTTVSCSRLGSVLGGFILPELYDINKDLTLPLMIAVVFCIFSFIVMIVLLILDRKADKQEKQDNSWQNELSDEQNLIKLIIKEKKSTPNKIITFKDIKDFPLLFWLLAISCLLNYICVVVFLQFGEDFFVARYQDKEKTASQFLTIPLIISATLSPVIGFLADRIGHRQYLLFFSSCLMTLAHILFLIIPDCPEPEKICSKFNHIFPLVLIGIFYAFYAAILWPCIPIVLEKNQVGTGFGITMCIQNFGLFSGPLIVSSIIDFTKYNKDGYFYSQIFFIIVGIICILISILIILINNKSGNKLGKIKHIISKQDSNILQQSFQK